MNSPGRRTARPKTALARGGTLALVGALLAVAPACTCARKDGTSSGSSGVGEGGAAPSASAASTPAVAPGRGFSAPIAAVRGEAGEVFVAGLDVSAKTIRVERRSATDAVLAEQSVFDGAAWSSDVELRLLRAERGVVAIWRGKREGDVVRQFVRLGEDLGARGAAETLTAAACTTEGALWSTDGVEVRERPWTGDGRRAAFPKEREAALACGAKRAFTVLDDERGTSVAVLGGAGGLVGAHVSLLDEADFGEDEQRERAEYIVGDDLGVVRLSASGRLTIRELAEGAPRAAWSPKGRIPRESDVVAVDATASAVVIVFTEDLGQACTTDGATVAAARVKALRVDRRTHEEEILELWPGACGREIGPFFTGQIKDALSVAWGERAPGASADERAPIVALVHARVPSSGPGGGVATRIDLNADALVDAGCDGARCYAAALERHASGDVMIPGPIRVLRY